MDEVAELLGCSESRRAGCTCTAPAGRSRNVSVRRCPKMSIDQRLRAGLRDGDAPDRPVLEPARLAEGWADVVARAEEPSAPAHPVGQVEGLAAAAVLVVAAAATWWPRAGEDHGQPIQQCPAPRRRRPRAPRRPGRRSTEAGGRIGPVPAQGIVDHLESVGLGRSAETVLQNAPASATIEYELKLQGGRSTLTLAARDGAAVVQDVQAYEVAGPTSPSPVGSDARRSSHRRCRTTGCGSPGLRRLSRLPGHPRRRTHARPLRRLPLHPHRHLT